MAYLKNSLLGPPLSKASSPTNSIKGFLVQEKFLLDRASSALFRSLSLLMITCILFELRYCCWNALSKDVTSVSSWWSKHKTYASLTTNKVTMGMYHENHLHGYSFAIIYSYANYRCSSIGLPTKSGGICGLKFTKVGFGAKTLPVWFPGLAWKMPLRTFWQPVSVSKFSWNGICPRWKTTWTKPGNHTLRNMLRQADFFLATVLVKQYL